LGGRSCDLFHALLWFSQRCWPNRGWHFELLELLDGRETGLGHKLRGLGEHPLLAVVQEPAPCSCAQHPLSPFCIGYLQLADLGDEILFCKFPA
jgi:hypothetical protein